jgi:hypothetical protein
MCIVVKCTDRDAIDSSISDMYKNTAECSIISETFAAIIQVRDWVFDILIW